MPSKTQRMNGRDVCVCIRRYERAWFYRGKKFDGCETRDARLGIAMDHGPVFVEWSGRTERPNMRAKHRSIMDDESVSQNISRAFHKEECRSESHQRPISAPHRSSVDHFHRVEAIHLIVVQSISITLEYIHTS